MYFVVHFPTFIKLAKKYGLKFVRKEKFYNFFVRMQDEGKTLLENMKGLETYPPPDNCKPIGTSEDYRHVEEYINRKFGDRTHNVSIGTLSNSEWEASCKFIINKFKYIAICLFILSALYSTFVFEKVKNTWNTDGTPLYEF